MTAEKNGADKGRKKKSDWRERSDDERSDDGDNKAGGAGDQRIKGLMGSLPPGRSDSP